MSKKSKVLLIVIMAIAVLALLTVLFIRHEDPKEPYSDNVVEEKTQEVDEEETEVKVEDVLPSLIKEGYKKTDEGYRISEFAEDVSSERTVNADGNKLEVTLKYDYGDGNAGMKKYFKQQDEAVYVMVSGFLANLGSKAGANDATMHYTIYVGGDKVRDGEMDLPQALEYQELLDD